MVYEKMGCCSTHHEKKDTEPLTGHDYTMYMDGMHGRHANDVERYKSKFPDRYTRVHNERVAIMNRLSFYDPCFDLERYVGFIDYRVDKVARKLELYTRVMKKRGLMKFLLAGCHRIGPWYATYHERRLMERSQGFKGYEPAKGTTWFEKYFCEEYNEQCYERLRIYEMDFERYLDSYIRANCDRITLYLWCKKVNKFFIALSPHLMDDLIGEVIRWL